jgi:hypothetical protein
MARKNKGANRSPEVKPLTTDDLFVRRDDDGKLIPLEVPLLGRQDRTIKILPTTIGSVKGLQNLEKQAAEWPLDEKIRYVREHVVEPDLSQVTAEQIMDGLTLWDLDMLLITAVQAGGPNRRAGNG